MTLAEHTQLQIWTFDEKINSPYFNHICVPSRWLEFRNNAAVLASCVVKLSEHLAV